MSDTFVNLKLDRALIDPHFDGYKLSLDSVPIYQKALESEVNVQSLRNDQYSYQHMKAFGVHNHLYADPNVPNTVYTIDERRKVCKFSLPEDLTSPVCSSVLAIPSSPQSRTNEDVLNASLHFTSPEWLVLADGYGTFHIVHTQDRTLDKNWEIKSSSRLDNDCTPFTVIHSTFYEVDNTPTIDAVFVTVTKLEEAEENKKDEAMETENETENDQAMEEGDAKKQNMPETKSAFVTTLNWITLIEDADKKSWKVSRTRKLNSLSSPDFVCLVDNASAIVVASEKSVKFVYDSEKPVEKEKKKEDWVVVEEGASASSDPPPFYTWSQTMEDVSVTFTLPPGTNKVDVVYKLSHDHLELAVKNGAKLLCGQLHAGVDPEGSTWTMDQTSRRLTLELCKNEEALWPVVVLGDNRGEMTLDPKQVEEIHKRLAHLTSAEWNPEPSLDSGPPAYNAQQLEDCDIFPDENSLLARIDGETHIPTHQVNLGGHQWLFNAHTSSSSSVFCLRHDVDGVVWKPLDTLPDASSTPPFQHVGTFNALGYVAASKRERKFSTCAPDLSYAALVDCARHVYVYRQPEPIATSPLRNRKTGRQVAAIAKQQLVSLESMDAILGVHASNNNMFVLTKSTLYVLRTKEEKDV